MSQYRELRVRRKTSRLIIAWIYTVGTFLRPYVISGVREAPRGDAGRGERGSGSRKLLTGLHQLFHFLHVFCIALSLMIAKASVWVFATISATSRMFASASRATGSVNS